MNLSLFIFALLSIFLCAQPFVVNATAINDVIVTSMKVLSDCLVTIICFARNSSEMPVELGFMNENSQSPATLTLLIDY